MSVPLARGEIQPRTTRPAAAAGRGPVRPAWPRIRPAVQEMNCASRRVIELQAPWSVDKQWRGR